MFFLLLISLFIAVLLEATIVQIPLSFILLLVFSILNRSGKVFLTAFLTGILLDVMTVRPIGSTSIYFLAFLAVLLLYQRKYEIRSYLFVTVSSFAGVYLYLLLFSNGSFVQSILSSIIAIVIFTLGESVKRKALRKIR